MSGMPKSISMVCVGKDGCSIGCGGQLHRYEPNPADGLHWRCTKCDGGTAKGRPLDEVMEHAPTTDERIAELEKTVALLVKRDRFTSSRIAYLEGLEGIGGT